MTRPWASTAAKSSAAEGGSGGRRRWRQIPHGGERGATAALPLPHRLALLYLAVPLGIWLIGWFEWWVGAPMAALLAVAFGGALRGRWRPSISRLGVGVALLMFGFVLSFPAGGLFTPEGQDWVHHRALLLDLGRGDWPTYLTEFGDRPAPLLRYYLGYHIVPGLLGKWLGAGALNWLVPLWTWIGATLLAVLFVRGLPSLRAALLAIVVGVALFSGMDALQYVLREGPVDGVCRFWERVSRRLSPVFLITRDSPMLLDYFSNALQFRNTPHHFLAGGLGAMLIVQLREQPRFLAVVGVVLVCCAFWSASATVGLGVLAAGLFFGASGGAVRRMLAWPNALAAPLLAGVVGLYLASGTLDFPRGWLWEIYDDGWRMAGDVLTLYLCEFLLLAVLVWRLRPSVVRDPVFLAALLVLLAAPWYWYGDTDFSELTLRVAVPSLFVLSYHAARLIAARLPEVAAAPAPRGDLGGKPTVASRFAFALLVVALCVGSLSALAEFATVLRRPGWLPYEQTRTTLQLVSVKDAGQRLARDPPALLNSLLRDHDNKGGSKGELVLRTDYDLYLRGNLLVYARTTCDVDFERTTRFFLCATDANAADAVGQPAQWRRYREFAVRPAHFRRGHPCVHGRRLPAWALRGVRLGQIVAGEGVVWEAEAPLTAAGRGAARVLRRSEEFFAARYRALRAGAVGAPAARSRFDVHVAGDALIFAKTPCGAGDTTAKFFVHAFPVRSQSLPAHRRAAGFVNLDFHFGERGAFADGGCATAAPLPPYPLRRLRVGQWREPGGSVWQAEIALPSASATAG